MIVRNNNTDNSHREKGKQSDPVPHIPGGRNTWLGDSEQIYDRYNQDIYSSEDYLVRRGHRYRYESEYPPQDRDRDRDLSEFSMGRRASRLKKNQEPAEGEWGGGDESGYDPYYTGRQSGDY